MQPSSLQEKEKTKKKEEKKKKRLANVGRRPRPARREGSRGGGTMDDC